MATSTYPLHQIWLQGEDRLPSKYEKTVAAYRAMTTGYRLWSYADIVGLLNTDAYEWLLPMFNSYQHWVMRVDLAKYVILHKYGGFYIDMDTVPKASFTPLTAEKSRVTIEVIMDNPVFKYLEFMFTLVNNHFFWVPYPSHPFMMELMKQANVSASRMFYEVKFWYVIDSAGPNLLDSVANRFPEMLNRINATEMRKYYVHEGHATWMSFDTHDKIFFFVLVMFGILLVKAYRWKR